MPVHTRMIHALVAEIRRLRRCVEDLEEAQDLVSLRAHEAAVRAARETRIAQEEAERIRKQADDLYCERQSALRALDRARQGGHAYEIDRATRRLKRC